MNQEENLNNQVERNEEFFKIRKELFKAQLKFAAIAVVIFSLLLLFSSFYLKNLDSNYIAYFFFAYLFICAFLWEKKYKLDILNKYDPKYKKITNWN
jgi:hypothetical protein